MDPRRSCANLLPEDLTQILISSETIRQLIQNQKKCIREVQHYLQKAKDSKDAYRESNDSLFTSISQLINDSFPVFQEFTNEHELAVRDFIYFEVLGWDPTNSIYWVHKPNGEQIRKHPKAFQETNKRLGNQ